METLFTQGLLITAIILLILNFIQNMSNQSRLDAANEKTFQAVVGIGKDMQAFIQEVKDAQGGSVSEESIAKAEANANALAALDAEKTQEEAPEPTEETGEDESEG